MGSRIEKTMVELFERKRSIIEEVKRQTDLFERHLFSKFTLLYGFPPPPSLLPPSNESKKEELLALHSHKRIKGLSRFSVVSQLCTSEAQCGLNVVPEHEHDASVTSPPNDCGEGGVVSDTYVDHAQSLMKIQRSKSRQRALEIRNSAKSSKKRSCDGATGPRNISLCYDNGHDLKSLRPVKDKNSGSCAGRDQQRVAIQDCILEPSLRFTEHATNGSEVRKLVLPSASINRGAANQPVAGDNLEEVGKIIFSERITRSTGCESQSCLVENSFGMVNSAAIAKEDNVGRDSLDRSIQQFNNVFNSGNPSALISDEAYKGKSENITENGGTEMGSHICSGPRTRSRHCGQPCSYNDEGMLQGGSGGEIKDGTDGAKGSNPVGEVKRLSEQFYIAEKSCGEAELLGCQNKEGTIAYFGTSRTGQSPTEPHNNGSALQLAFSFDQSLPHQRSNMRGGIVADTVQVSSKQVNFLSSSNRSATVDLEKDDIVVADTDVDSDELVENGSVTSGVKSVSTNPGFGVLFSKPPTNCAASLNPKQLDFDNMEEGTINGTLAPKMEKKKIEEPPKDVHQILVQSAGALDQIESVNSQKSTRSQLLEQEFPNNIEIPLRDSSEASNLKQFPVLFNEGTSRFVQQKLCSPVLHNHNADPSVVSQPLFKRMKTGDQDYIIFSQSTSIKKNQRDPTGTYHVGNSMRSSLNKSLGSEMHQAVANHVKERPESASPKTHVDKDETRLEGILRTSLVSSMGKQAVGLSQSCLSAKADTEYPNSFMEETLQLIVEENRLEQGYLEHLICTENNKHERKSHLSRNEHLASTSFSSPLIESIKLSSSDQNMPEFESFVVGTGNAQTFVTGEGIDFGILGLSADALERASILEQLCKSACWNTPFSHLSNHTEQHETSSFKEQLNASHECSNSQYLPLYDAQSLLDAKKSFTPPVMKLWDGILAKTCSSEKQARSIPELPSINEENENIEELADKVEECMGKKVKRVPLTDITSTCPQASDCENLFDDRQSVASVSTKLGSPHNNGMKRIRNAKENQTLSLGANNVKRTNESLHTRLSKPKLSAKNNARNQGPNLLERESKRNNIVSNVTSFIPLVQQKQATAIATGKRDIKVKALEAAEAAKRLAEQKDNERKIRKKALKLERARMEEENLRQMQLEKEKKEEERKRKEARKRQREEEERKENERKRKYVEEARKQQYEKQRETKRRAADPRATERKEVMEKSGKLENLEKPKENKNHPKLSESHSVSIVVSAANTSETSTIGQTYQELPGCSDNSKVFNVMSIETEIEPSYEISPYKLSDDEDEDEDEESDDDDVLNTKFIPSWASSKSRVARAVSSQQAIDPESIFSKESFCNINEVLLPRRFQQKQ